MQIQIVNYFALMSHSVLALLCMWCSDSRQNADTEFVDGELNGLCNKYTDTNLNFGGIIRAKKEPQNQRIARTAPKNCLNNSRALPNKTCVLRQTAPENSPESSAKSLSQKFFGVPFLFLKSIPYLFLMPLRTCLHSSLVQGCTDSLTDARLVVVNSKCRPI